MATNVLLIEDDKGYHELIRLRLNEQNFRHHLYISETLADGIDLVQTRPIDVVLLDLELSDSVGYKTVPNFKNAVTGIPLIVLTSTANPVISVRSVEAGAQDYLVKGDFDGKRLISVIRFAIARSEQEKERQKVIKKLEEASEKDKRLRELVQVGDWQMDIVDMTMEWSEAVYSILGRETRIKPTRSDFLTSIYKEDRSKVEEFLDEVSRLGDAKQISCRIIIDNRKIQHVAISAKVEFDKRQNKLILFGTVQLALNTEDPTAPPAPPPPPSRPDSVLERLSFDLRTPLTSMANLTYLLEQTTLQPRQKELIQNMRDATDEFNLIVNQLLNYVLLQESTPQDGNTTIFSLTNLCEAVQRLANFQADRENIQLSFTMSPSLPKQVKGSSKHVSQLFYNLISRVLTLRNTHRTLHVEVEGTEAEETLHLRLLLFYYGQAYNWPKESVFKSDALQERPHTELLDGVIAKIGRQLRVRHQLTKSAEGEIRLRVELPLKIEQEATANTPMQPRSNLHLLLVEDHPLQRLAIQQVLKGWSPMVSVKVVENGQEALDLEDIEAFDLILMDLKLPKVDGLEAARILRSRNYSGPIIALTAGVSAQEEQEAMAAGMNEYMLKPFQPEDLYRTILQLLRKGGHSGA